MRCKKCKQYLYVSNGYYICDNCDVVYYKGKMYTTAELEELKIKEMLKSAGKVLFKSIFGTKHTRSFFNRKSNKI